MEGTQAVEETEQQEGQQPEPKKASKSSSFLRTILELIIALAIALVLTGLIKAFVVEMYIVPTGSMETTVMTGDRILANKMAYDFGNKPQRGDIIVFVDKADSSRILLKRVVATEGQTVDLRNGTVYVDGQPMLEPYVNGQASDPLPTTLDNMSITYPFTVPSGCVWVMGDNRENSADSRYFGAIEDSSVLGKAFMIVYPFNQMGMLQ
jgi:signal peptidase I